MPSRAAARSRVVGGSNGSGGFDVDDAATEPDGNVSPSVAIRSGSKRTGALKAWRILTFKYGRNKPRAENGAGKSIAFQAACSLGMALTSTSRSACQAS